MSEQDAWKYSLVCDFFAGYNWTGKTADLTKVHSGGSQPKNWQLQTVQTFLGQFNWTGVSTQHLDHIAMVEGLSNRLAVKDFLQFFAWQGQANIAAVPVVPKEAPAPIEDDLSLNDFTDLF